MSPDAALEIAEFDATELSQLLHARELSCSEVMTAYLSRIQTENPQYTAVVNLAPPDFLLQKAEECDDELARGSSRGWLHGIPLAIKDTSDAIGFPTTKGSKLLRGNMPSRDSIMVERLRGAGCVVVGKTNVPELALGSHTFNDVFGLTPNAWDKNVSAGGSSGGAAVALSRRFLPIADGSDFMGSLRNPAGWNSIFALRPTQGRIPQGPGADIWVEQLGTAGPMARTVRDLGNLIKIQAGYDERQPLSLQSDIELAEPTDENPASVFLGLRVGWLGDLNGYLPFEDGVLDTCRIALEHFTSGGAQVQDAAPEFDTDAAWRCWLTLRRAMVGARVEPLLALPGAYETLKQEAIWEYECYKGLSYADFIRASQLRTRFYQQLSGMLKKWDVLAIPTAQVWPFPIDQRWPSKVAGRSMDTYHRWMESSIYATLGGCPSLAIPAGFHAERGWPMGLQLIGRHSAEGFLLRIARAYEAKAKDVISRSPLPVRPSS